MKLTHKHISLIRPLVAVKIGQIQKEINSVSMMQHSDAATELYESLQLKLKEHLELLNNLQTEN